LKEIEKHDYKSVHKIQNREGKPYIMKTLSLEHELPDQLLKGIKF
jgi:hypothetical protein